MRDTSQVHRSQSASLPRYAIEFGEWMARVGNERARALGHAKLRPAHNRLIGFIEFEGSRIVDIAQAQAVSKNAIGQLVTDLEELGYLERVPDPADGRAKIVRYTDRGKKLLTDTAAIVEQLDSEVRAVIGERRLAELRSTLAEICHHFGLNPSA
ncbi:DNA-binding transcriptional regulator, MarR family [Mycolicibacterium rutilum]|uniref:DNA-binding transcriptional regulator, MarR family n=1 Tax=Mycolicibacterium rutilum TaxID=370526 RepID=A0A1H6K0A5_MYCRU|nr:MarR family winged helix-turn-helix transcriptional regulator [Mycolicibacterium rutilum]SEH68381.1 DNA-binding transcriptional regulator, MarR family [Mycolicibacterium rutilum]